MNLYGLTYAEQRGEITYIRPDGTFRVVPGHFMLELDGQGIIHRKVGGRNRYRFCSLDAVVQFRKETR